jgi:hypothetical protein
VPDGANKFFITPQVGGEDGCRGNGKPPAKGNPYLNVDGSNVVVFPHADGTWGFRIENRATGDALKSSQLYPSSDAAKLAAFDAVILMKDEGRRLTATKHHPPISHASLPGICFENDAASIEDR